MRWILPFSIMFVLTFAACNKNATVHSQKTANQLINETSPYLLQHAYNPVDWHPWSEKTLKKAQAEDKLLIISIGYSACHWCHVMEHESFEDSTVAALMNEHFIPIKVDREERPDVDDIYMNAAQLISGRGGWPLNAVALPDGRPIWAGTYYPKDNWMDILNQFATLQQNDMDRLTESAEKLTQGISTLDDIVVSIPKPYSETTVMSIAKKFISSIDEKHGGKKGIQKFPRPNNFDYLLKYGAQHNDKDALDLLHLTLEKMAFGGIYDQVGGGFSRYSVDTKWFAPHFEKMLYDNSQLVSLYSNAFRQDPKPLYREIVVKTLAFVERELMDENERFYSSLDADSEGKEGKFYVWSYDELEKTISQPEDFKIISDYYNITKKGNWEHGNNILHRTKSKEDISKKYDVSISQLDNIIARFSHQLMEIRESRVRPGLDDKILTSWNALMISAYVDAYKAFGHDELIQLAIRSMHRLLQHQMQDNFRLERNYKDGVTSINGFLDDYATTIEACLDLYEVTFDESWLNIAKPLSDYVIDHFYDNENKMFFYTSDIDPPLVTRKTEIADNQIPASNSILARAFLHLGELNADQSLIDKAVQMMANVSILAEETEDPSFYTNWLQLQMDIQSPPYEIAILGDDALKLSHEMMQTYRPNAVFLGSFSESIMPLLKYKYQEGKTMIYVCQNKACKFPVDNIEAAEKLLTE